MSRKTNSIPSDTRRKENRHNDGLHGRIFDVDKFAKTYYPKEDNDVSKTYKAVRERKMHWQTPSDRQHGVMSYFITL